MIKLENINITYGKRHIVSGDCFQAPGFGLCSIYGESGSGKTSLLKSIILEENNFEKYYFQNKKIENYDEFKNQNISYLSQKALLIEDLSIQNHLDLFENDSQKNKLIEILQLGKLLKKYPPQLSGGEKTRIGFALSLLHNKPILVLDEPTSSLDSDLAVSVRELIYDYSRTHLVIVSTHDLEFINISDTVYKIENKSIQCIKEADIEEHKKLITSKFSMNAKKRIYFYLNLKKRKWKYNCFISALLIFSITFTSFGVSRLLSGEKYQTGIEGVYDNEIFVYKMIDKKYHSDFSKMGSEFPFEESEIVQIKNIDNVKEVKENYLLNQHPLLPRPEETEYYSRFTPITIYNENDEIIQNGEYPNYEYDNGAGTTVSVYFSDKDYSTEIETYTGYDKGWYISKRLASQLDIPIEDDSQFYLEATILIPQLIGYGDSNFVSYDEKVTIPICRLQGSYVKIKLPISGVLKDSFMGNNYGEATSIFMPHDIFLEYLDMYKETSSYNYRYISGEGYFKVENDNLEGNIMHCEPYSPNSLIVIVNDISGKKAVIEKLEAFGYGVYGSVSNSYVSSFQNNTEQNAFYIFVGSLSLISVVYFIVQYLNIKSEYAIECFFNQIGFSKKDANKILIGKYAFECIVLIGFCYLLANIYFLACQYYEYFPISAHSTYYLIIIILTILIVYLYPVMLLKIKGKN